MVMATNRGVVGYNNDAIFGSPALKGRESVLLCADNTFHPHGAEKMCLPV